MGRKIEIMIKTDDCNFKYIVDKEGYESIRVQIPNYYLEEKNLTQAKELFKLIKETFDKQNNK